MNNLNMQNTYNSINPEYIQCKLNILWFVNLNEQNKLLEDIKLGSEIL